MRKIEMATRQLQERSTVIQMLLIAGWKGPVDAEMFEKGRLCDLKQEGKPE